MADKKVRAYLDAAWRYLLDNRDIAGGVITSLGALGTKNPPIDADKAIYRDSTASDALVTSTWTQIKAFLKTYFDTLYNLYVHPNHSGDVTSVADGTQTLVNKQSVTFTAPLATTQAISVVAAAAPTVSIPAATASAAGHATAAQITKLDGIEASAVALATVKADADIADAISKKHTAGTDTALGALSPKNPPIDADLAIYRDSTASDALVTSTWTQIKAFLKTYFDGLYSGGSGTLSEVLGFAIISLPDSHGLYADYTAKEFRIRTSLAVEGENILVIQGYNWIDGGLRLTI